MTQVACAGHDGRIYLTDLHGSYRSELVSSSLLCSWPTWSPDGSSISFSGYRSGYNGHAHLGVYARRIAEPAPRLVYSNEPGTDAIARKTPHYACWSPDASKLAFIAQTWGAGLSLFTWDAASDAQPRRLIDGGPLYFSWSHDSRYLIVHSGQSHYLVDFQGDGKPGQMPGTATLYMAPAWSPVANRVAICRDAGDNHHALMLLDMDSGRVQALREISGGASFAWSPDGSVLALGQDLDRQSGFYAGLWLVYPDSNEQVQAAEEPVLCFFWSRDGSKIAYVTPSQGGTGSIRWAIMSISDDDTVYLADFRPTQEQLTTFMFFDQYGQSHSPWSPDSQYLLFSGVLGFQVVRTALPEGPDTSIYVANADGLTMPRALASGVLGSCSPVQ